MASITPGRRSTTRPNFLREHFDHLPPGFNPATHPIIALHFLGLGGSGSRTPRSKRKLVLPPGPGELAAARYKWWLRAKAEGLTPIPGVIDIPGGRP